MSTWNKDKLNKLGNLLNKKDAVKKVEEYPEEFMDMALVDVLPSQEWTDEEAFKEFLERNLTKGYASGIKYPFRVVIDDKSGDGDKYWIFKSYIDINNTFYESSERKYPKKLILSSPQFFHYLVSYIDAILPGKVYVSISLGYVKPDDTRAIKYYERDLEKLGATDIKNFICVDFKKRGQRTHE